MPSRALLTEVQTISNAEIVQALANIKIVATSGITTTLPTTSSTLAILAGNTFTGTQSFSGTINLVATTSTTGQILQAGSVIFHTFRTDNLFLGAGAGNFGATLGSNNIGIGKNSLLACTTGSSNTAIGRVTMTALTTGSNNVAVGDDTGTGITDGEYNILVGRNAGKAITTGDYNSAIGGLSLSACIAGSSNVAIGYQSLGSTNAGNNTAVGFNSGYYSTSNNGTYIGHSAGIATATVGGLAGVAITSGANNTMIGQSSSSTSATGTYRTAIGSDSRCESNNAIKLGRDTLDVVLLPKMTTAELATAATTLGAVKGAIAYCTDGVHADHVHFYNGSSWAKIG
jgi:hypothetical protein